MPIILSELPQFPLSSPTPPNIPLPEYELRLAHTRDAMLRRSLTHLIIYADREHSANMAWLTGFDPRFEEALLILRPDTTPLILVGTECESYLPISPLFKAGRLRHERFEPFSLLNINRNNSRQLHEILRAEALNPDSTPATAGWKYFHPTEHSLGNQALEIPAFIADTIRAIAPNTVNATDLFHHPATGLRTFCSAAEIALFEHSNILASNGMRNMIEAIRPGMTDFDLAAHMGFNGLPHSCHWTVKTGPNRISLASPSGNLVQRGQPLSANIGLAGANCCRCAFIAEDEHEAPEGYVQHFVEPYMAAMNEWFSMLRIGAIAGEIEARMRHLLPNDHFHVKLNPGHLIHLDEWLSSPFYPHSTVELHSGMAIQSDVIPSHPVFISTRMEDTYVLADTTLQTQLQRDHPDCFARCLARRHFMRNVLGLQIPGDLLPLSNLPGVISPYLLAPHKFLALR